MSYKKEIEEKIHQIAKLLSDKKVLTNNLSVIGGNAGIALFHFYYYQLFLKEENNNNANDIINDTFDSINNGFSFHTFAGGLSGIGWLVELLQQNDFIESDTDEIIGDLDDFLFEYLKKDIKNGNYDYLHGASGIALYFLKRKDSKKKERYLSEFVDLLDEISIKDENGIKWISDMRIDENSSEKVYNLSMSHGIASLISILSKLYTQNINIEKTKNLLEGAVKYLLNQKQDINKYKSFFPSSVRIKGHKHENSRLAWCYGDLGISVAIWNASKELNDGKLEQNALDILQYTANRRDLKENHVLDAGLCHGTAGMAHIFKRMYTNTNISDFKDASDYWFNETLKMANIEDGIAGFKVWRPKEIGGLINDYGFLEGIAGIGLALISAISEIEPNWDEALLLS